jgi:type IV pilus assembly protein PilY1
MSRNLLSNKLLQGALLALGLSMAMAFRVADAATDLADVPMANATTATIRPNIAFVFDDSGSMDEENMPDGDSTNRGNYCYKWYKYNTLAYNPAQTYRPPMKADGTRYPDSSFTAALKDGYFASTEKQFDGVTNNGLINLTTLGSVTSTTAVIDFESLSGSKYYVTSVRVTLLNNTQVELLNSAAVPSISGTNSTDTLGEAVRDSINANTATTGFTASYDDDDNELIITAPASQAGLATRPSITRVKVSGSSRDVTISDFNTTTLSSGFYYATHNTNPNSTTCASNANYTAVTTSSGIAAPGVATGSAAALTNYANWYSYYRRRAFLMKAGVGEAFSALEQGKFRIGLFFINSIESGAGSTNHDLAVDTFSGTHRDNWFSRLYGARADGWTPLRGALSRMGQMYAGRISGWDPVQYSCQRNYTILSTDGFWNTNAESSSYGPKQMDGATNIGDVDGATGVTRPSYDSSRAQNTLADVAYYYYHTDLRPGTCSSPDVCTNNVSPAGTNANVDDMASHQHMTTFTVGLGVNGTLTYVDGYKSSSSGDYYDIKQGTKNWPNPVNGTNDSDDRIDDLWHAAVNGRGTYFSAKDPNTLSNGLTSSLNVIDSAPGSGAAAATSNLQPTTGDQAIYIANYRTVQWDGDVSAYTVDLSNGNISGTPSWQAAPLLNAKIGTSGDSDSRVIYTADGTTRILFKEGAGGLTSAQLAYFDNTKLSQYAGWSSGKRSAATAGRMVNYLRGQHAYEDQDSNTVSDNRLYRDREKILGDIIHSQPVYVKAPPHNFRDAGYATFKTSNQNRAATLYVAANDGMLHAFDASTGQERWAYVPPMVLPEMWRLADESYSSNHRFFLDGPIAISDANIGGTWKTVLIGALGKGGRGFYALDITDPANPVPLWNFTASNNSNVGYSFGTPFITKLDDGSGTGPWVAVLTSGYNNIPEGGNYASADGRGYVFVLNLADGSLIRSISTNVGSVTSPSGLARINVEVADFSTDNTAVGAYGGDLEGNMWHFDLVAGTARKVAAFGSNKPVTAGPEIGDIDGKKVIFFGTGRYLGEDDLADGSTQSIYVLAPTEF